MPSRCTGRGGGTAGGSKPRPAETVKSTDYNRNEEVNINSVMDIN